MRWRTDVLTIYRCKCCISSKNVCTHVFISNVALEFYFHFRPAFWTGTLFSSRCAHLHPKAWFFPGRCCVGGPTALNKDPTLSWRHRLCKQQLADVEEEVMGMSHKVLIPLICSYEFFGLFVFGLYFIFRQMFLACILSSVIYALSYAFHNEPCC